MGIVKSLSMFVFSVQVNIMDGTAINIAKLNALVTINLTFCNFIYNKILGQNWINNNLKSLTKTLN